MYLLTNWVTYTQKYMFKNFHSDVPSTTTWDGDTRDLYMVMLPDKTANISILVFSI